MNKLKAVLMGAIASVSLGTVAQSAAPIVVEGNTISAPNQQDKLERPTKQPGMEKRVRQVSGNSSTRHLKTP